MDREFSNAEDKFFVHQLVDRDDCTLFLTDWALYYGKIVIKILYVLNQRQIISHALYDSMKTFFQVLGYKMGVWTAKAENILKVFVFMCSEASLTWLWKLPTDYVGEDTFAKHCERICECATNILNAMCEERYGQLYRSGFYGNFATFVSLWESCFKYASSFRLCHTCPEIAHYFQYLQTTISGESSLKNDYTNLKDYVLNMDVLNNYSERVKVRLYVSQATRRLLPAEIETHDFQKEISRLVTEPFMSVLLPDVGDLLGINEINQHLPSYEVNFRELSNNILSVHVARPGIVDRFFFKLKQNNYKYTPRGKHKKYFENLRDRQYEQKEGVFLEKDIQKLFEQDLACLFKPFMLDVECGRMENFSQGSGYESSLGPAFLKRKLTSQELDFDLNESTLSFISYAGGCNYFVLKNFPTISKIRNLLYQYITAEFPDRAKLLKEYIFAMAICSRNISNTGPFNLVWKEKPMASNSLELFKKTVQAVDMMIMVRKKYSFQCYKPLLFPTEAWTYENKTKAVNAKHVRMMNSLLGLKPTISMYDNNHQQYYRKTGRKTLQIDSSTSLGYEFTPTLRYFYNMKSRGFEVKEILNQFYGSQERPYEAACHYCHEVEVYETIPVYEFENLIKEHVKRYCISRERAYHLLIGEPCALYTPYKIRLLLEKFILQNNLHEHWSENIAQQLIFYPGNDTLMSFYRCIKEYDDKMIVKVIEKQATEMKTDNPLYAIRDNKLSFTWFEELVLELDFDDEDDLPEQEQMTFSMFKEITEEIDAVSLEDID